MNSSTPSNVFDALVPILCEHTGFHASEIQPGTHLREDLDIDSLTMHGILMSIEDQFGVLPAAATVAAAASAADLAAAVHAQVQS